MKLRDAVWAVVAVMAGVAAFILIRDVVTIQQMLRSTGLATAHDHSSAYSTAQGLTAGIVVTLIGLYALALHIGDRNARETQRRRLAKHE